MKTPLQVGIVGCGAVAELYYAPALVELSRMDNVRVTGLFDPEPGRIARLAHSFPGATSHTSLEGLLNEGLDLTIVASPPRFHAHQAIGSLNRGIAVLCEKPMAATTAEARAMIEAAQKTSQLLAIGLFRRFFPVNLTIYEVARNRRLGKVNHVDISEGGHFSWPAQSASFFEKSKSQGGVLADIGVHVLDLLIWWFGVPKEVAYYDDAMGGLEANCRVELEFASGIVATVRLSRDTPIPNRTVITCEHGWLRCEAASAKRFEIGFSGGTYVLEGEALSMEGCSALDGLRAPAPTYQQGFLMQLRNVVAAVRGEASLLVPGEEGLHSLELIERCYKGRKLMRMPWLSETESTRALSLAGSGWS